MRCTRAGMTLTEVVVVISVIGVFAAIATARLARSFEDAHVKSAARSAADLFLLARGEAMRTGRNHVVFFGPPGTADPAGTPLQDAAGRPVPMLLLNDGPPATSNCRIDAGEPIETIPAEPDVSWGATLATGPVATDRGTASYLSGSTFADPTSAPTHWVLFRPDGVPVVFTASGGNCGVVGGTGSGGAGLYVTNGNRDYAVILAPLGGVRVHAWNAPAAQWSS